MSQRSRILDRFIANGEAGVYVYELTNSRPDGEGASQYGARIKELRALGHNIVNDRLGHFILVNSPKTDRVMNEPKINRSEIEANIERLRVEWKNADPTHKKLIQIRAELLKKKLSEAPAEPEATAEDAERILNEN